MQASSRQSLDLKPDPAGPADKRQHPPGGLANAPLATLPNLVSLLRVFLVPPILYFLSQPTRGASYLVLGLMIVAALTDLLDGYLARRLGQQSEWGKVFDPLADKVVIGVIGAFLVIFRDFPLWLLVLLLVRDGLILLGGWIIFKKKGRILASNYSGKLTTCAVALTGMVYVLGGDMVEVFKQVSLTAALLLLFISSSSYARRFVGIMTDKP